MLPLVPIPNLSHAPYRDRKVEAEVRQEELIVEDHRRTEEYPDRHAGCIDDPLDVKGRKSEHQGGRVDRRR